jgi:diguanylate cyclase (GGDEF)-like protein/PAS domain S-box-containing protein
MIGGPSKPLRHAPDADGLRLLAGFSLPARENFNEMALATRQLMLMRHAMPAALTHLLMTFSISGWYIWPIATAAEVAWLVWSICAIGSAAAVAGLVSRTAASDTRRTFAIVAIVAILFGISTGAYCTIAEGYVGALIAMTMFVGGTIYFAAVPLAAICYVAAATLAGLVLAPRTDDAVLIGLLALVLVTFIAVLGRSRLKAVTSQDLRFVEREQAARLASSFEQCGAGWFWETDSQGRLTYISPAFLSALGTSADSLIGQPFAAIADSASSELASGDRRALDFHLRAQLPFHEVTLPVRFPVGLHWWSLSGQPRFDSRNRFTGFSGFGTDLTEVRRSEDQVARLARFDSLTGLANRVTIRDTLDATLTQARNGRQPCALFLIDLDRFKTVNDTLGHPTGDALLEQVAERLETLVGTAGRVGRLGGDEFAIVVHDASLRRDVEAFANRIIDYLSAPYSIETHRVVIGASIGIAIGPDDGKTVDALMRNADLALYAAKGDGRGRLRFYEADMHADADARRRLEVDLRAAIATGALSLAFQPIVDASSECLAGFEALARWQHPIQGEVSPARFIPLAEETGLIDKIGEWVLRTACAEAAHWPDTISVAVNLSPLQFANPEFATVVLNALAQSGLDPRRLELEVTEGVFLKESAATRSTLQRLDAIGTRLTLDDFGTGYSSLGYLHRAPFRKIKIDRSFVHGISGEHGQRPAIVRAIVALAESLGMTTTAEGAETIADLEAVRELGCMQVQGHVYGRAIAAEEARRMAADIGPLARQGFQKPREPRSRVLRKVDIGTDGFEHRAVIRNISGTGALVEAEWVPQIGERIELSIDGQRTRTATVRWAANGRFGVMFDAHYIPASTVIQNAMVRRAAA